EIKDLRPRMEESLDTVVALMKGETVTRKTDWFELHEARLSVGCFTEPMMEIAVTTIRSPAGVVAAGRHGLGVLTLGHMNDAVLEHHTTNWNIYEDECRKHGHTPDRSKWRITLMMHVAETREKALADTGWGFPNISTTPMTSCRLPRRYRAARPIRRNSRSKIKSPLSARPTTRSARSSACARSSAASAPYCSSAM